VDLAALDKLRPALEGAGGEFIDAGKRLQKGRGTGKRKWPVPKVVCDPQTGEVDWKKGDLSFPEYALPWLLRRRCREAEISLIRQEAKTYVRDRAAKGTPIGKKKWARPKRVRRRGKSGCGGLSKQRASNFVSRADGKYQIVFISTLTHTDLAYEDDLTLDDVQRWFNENLSAQKQI
jgi:hypothetical protein